MSDVPVALVTSGFYGLGAEIVRYLATSGTQVAVGERPQDFGNRSNGPSAAASIHHGLISSPADCARVVKEVVEQHSRLNILVCVAVRRGLSSDCPVERMGAVEWDRHLAAYLSGPFYLVRAALPHMLAQGYGRIVFVLPVEGGRGSVGQAAAGVASAGLVALTRRMAREVADRGVTVNAVASGLESGFSLEDMPEEVIAQVTAAVPAGRLAERSEVARMVAVLCAAESGYVTGQVIGVDGGLRA